MHPQRSIGRQSDRVFLPVPHEKHVATVDARGVYGRHLSVGWCVAVIMYSNNGLVENNSTSNVGDVRFWWLSEASEQRTLARIIVIP